MAVGVHYGPTRLAVIVQQRSWEAEEVQQVSRVPRAQISESKVFKGDSYFSIFLEFVYDTKRTDRRFASAGPVATLNSVPKGRRAVINLRFPLCPIRVTDAGSFIHRRGYRILPRVSQDRLKLERSLSTGQLQHAKRLTSVFSRVSVSNRWACSSSFDLSCSKTATSLPSCVKVVRFFSKRSASSTSRRRRL